MTNRLDAVAAAILAADEERVSRMREARNVITDYVLPALPHTINLFEAKYVSTGADYRSSDPHKLGSLHVKFEPGDVSTEEAAGLAYGTIIKVAEGLQTAGWTVERQPSMNVYDWQDGMDVSVMASRPSGDRPLTLVLTFEKMPETSRCEIVETVEEVPAGTRIVKRLVCTDGPAALLSGVKIEDRTPEGNGIDPDEEQAHADAGHPDHEQQMAEADHQREAIEGR